MSTKSFFSTRRVALCAVLSLLPSMAAAAPITVASELVDAYGDHYVGAGAVMGRYQQVYASDAFGGGGAVSIDELRFRPRMGNAFAITLSDVRVALSTTAAVPGGLSNTFEDNLGVDEAAVYEGALTLSSVGTSGTPSADFDLVVEFQTSFVYDPADGNLLVDWQSRGGADTGSSFVNFDAQYTGGSEPFSGLLAGGGGDLAGGALPGGLVTRFEATPAAAASAAGTVIPEPSGFLLFACGALFAIAPRRLR